MENTIKNMELVLTEMKTSLENGNIQSVKTLANTYLTLFSRVRREFNESGKTVGMYLSPILDHRGKLERLAKQCDEKLTDSVVKGHHKDSNDIAVTLERIDKSIRDIGYITPIKKAKVEERKEFPVSKEIEDLLNMSIKTGTLITFYDEVHRGQGKSTALIKKAAELDVVLLVRFESSAKSFRKHAKDMGLNVVIASTSELSLSQNMKKAKSKGYLVDEMVEIKFLKRLEGCKLLGGFTSTLI